MTSEERNTVVQYRINKAKETFDDAKLLASEKRWTACVNRLYYSVFYITIALLIKNGFETKSHNGVTTLFSMHFLKTKIVSLDDGELFAILQSYRTRGDYNDMFDFDEETVEPLLEPVQNFINNIESIINNPTLQ
jgi:uncharacterized protein (UPF0332 family)